MEHGRYKATSNYGVCVLGSTVNEYEVDYYGVLEEILELKYYGLKEAIVLFKCHWYDTSDKGMKIHRLGLVEINQKSKLNTNDPFILAAQAQQVYYIRSPTIKQERNDWVTACKGKARGKFDIPFLEEQDENVSPIVEVAYQEEEISRPHLVLIDIDIDNANIICDVDEEELNSMEIEELRRVMNGKQKLSQDEMLLQKLQKSYCSFCKILGCQIEGRKMLVPAEEDQGGEVEVDVNLLQYKMSMQHDTMPELDNIPNEVQDDVEIQISRNDVINDARYEEGSSSVVRRRGPNQGSQIPSNIDEQTKIHVTMNKFVEIDVPREITNDIKGMIKGSWPTWKKVPNDIKDLLWENFKLRYKWDNFTDREMKKKKDLGREVDEFEVFERMHKRKQGTGEFVDNKSARVSEQYRERLNVDDHITPPSFDLKSWCEVVGGQYKGRVYGFGRNQHFGRSYNGSSNEMCSNEKNNELSQEIEDMRATSKRMEKEIIESKNKLELVITENRQRENKLIEESRQREEKLMEEARQREENLKEMVRKMIQEAGYTNHLYPGGSGPREHRDKRNKN
ncbi:hypothetical protein ZIOFF_054122 [Zingiber officinale]|uniref:DUF4216 domain-containing protein n=1 Tax=Zingiber officinale TaxID=94328 RepID=A0A8J5FE23_ZINOF|nr:hypothetical protein ZIOFF_054122 [Zingiber officinale]